MAPRSPAIALGSQQASLPRTRAPRHHPAPPHLQASLIPLIRGRGEREAGAGGVVDDPGLVAVGGVAAHCDSSGRAGGRVSAGPFLMAAALRALRPASPSRPPSPTSSRARPPPPLAFTTPLPTHTPFSYCSCSCRLATSSQAGRVVKFMKYGKKSGSMLPAASRRSMCTLRQAGEGPGPCQVIAAQRRCWCGATLQLASCASHPVRPSAPAFLLGTCSCCRPLPHHTTPHLYCDSIHWM